jgi:predicted dehydrogenase
MILLRGYQEIGRICMAREIRFAFIGTGGVATLHAEAMRRLDNARLVGAWSPTPEHVAAFTNTYAIKAYRSLDELLDDRAIEAVAVLSSAESHFELGLRCLDAGKHILIEKPVAGSLEQIGKLKAAAGQRLCVPSHNYIYDPRLREAKRRLEAGDLGRLASVWMIYNQKHWKDWGSPSVLIQELMIHHAYVAIYFAGPPRAVSCTASNVFFSDSTFPDQAMAVIEHDGGIISNLWGSFGVDDFTSSPWTLFYKVLGLDGGFQMSWSDCQFGTARYPGWDKAAYRDSFYYVQEYFVDECLGKDRAPLSTMDDAAGALRVTEAMIESARSGARIALR